MVHQKNGLAVPKLSREAYRVIAGQRSGSQKAWRTKFFVFMTDRRVPATNNFSGREVSPSVVFRKVANGFCSDWGVGVHAGWGRRIPHASLPPLPQTRYLCR